MKKKILFLCTGNSCRSQIAEGFARYFHNDQFEFFSAGIEKHGMNPYAIKVMKEVGVDISGQYSKTLEDIGDVNFDVVYTVCGHAHENCPLFSGTALIVHAGFDDPPKLAAGLANEEEILSKYRRVRDEIREFVYNLK